MDKLKIIKSIIDEAGGIHCVIGNRYCSYLEEDYEDEFYICAHTSDNVEIFYDKKEYKYNSFEKLISDKIFNGKSIKELIDKIFLEGYDSN